MPAIAEAQHTFSRDRDTWRIEFAGDSVHVRDLKGLRYLARLLAEPGREFRVRDLVALEMGTTEDAEITGDAGPALDAHAKQMYRRRLAEIDEDLAEATARNDLGRLEQAEHEREFLVRELSRAVGLGGRDRRASSNDERARASVTRAMRQAIERIRKHHPACAEHLDRAVRTGTHCSYAPDAPIRWTL